MSGADLDGRYRHRPLVSDRAGLSSRIFGRLYRWMLQKHDRAIEISVGSQVAVRMPAQFARYHWEQYQPESVAAVVGWARQNPMGVVLDIGRLGAECEEVPVGIYSLIALFASPQVEVIAFDSDLIRLAKLRRLCKYAQGARLRAVYGFIGGTSTEVVTISEAIARTDNDFRAAAAWGGLGMMRYDVRINPFQAIPFRLLDHLFLQNALANRPVLIRSQQRGEQLGVLIGARRLLEKMRPHLLLTVHPQELSRYGNSREKVQSFLERMGYEFRCLAIGGDEEYWWCQFKAANRAEI